MRVENLCKTFDSKTVLNGFSAVFPNDGVVCLMGASGSGKTTLLNVLMGFLAPDAGAVKDVPERFSALFQEDTLCEDVSGVKNVTVASRVTKEEALRALEAVGLSRKDACADVSTYSGGMKRRCGIVRAMEAKGSYVFLDEPFKGLDEAARDRVAEYIKTARRGRGLLVVTHDAKDAERLDAQIVSL